MSLYDKSSLVLIPSGTKTGKVFSQKPVSGDGDFTFTRASAATRVNADGNIEKETSNKFIYSNNFNSGWSPKAGTFTQGIADPNGGSNAWSWTAVNTDPYLYQFWNLSGIHCVSIWAKGVGSTIGHDIEIRIGSNTAYFELTSEWQRFEHFADASGSNNIGFEFGNPAAASGDVIHIYAAQLEQGLVARDVITTTTAAVYGGITDNTPRLDYTDSSCPALLLEPQRTNIFSQSEYFSSSEWGLFSSATLGSSFIVSPEGNNNATTLNFGSGNESLVFYNYGSGSSTFTTSVWARSDSGKKFCFRHWDGSAAVRSSDFTTTSEWQRFDYTFTSPIVNFGICNQSAGGVGSIEIWGAQAELGSYATSYIPTYGSSVSRVVDDISTIFSSPIPTTGNVSYFIHLDGSDRAGNATGAHAAIRFAGNDYISYNNSGGGFHRFRVNINGTSNYYTGNLVKSQEAKLLAVINGNYIKIFMNGQQVNQGTLSGTPDLLSATQYTGVTNEALGPLPIKELLLISTALTDQEAIDLTTI